MWRRERTVEQQRDIRRRISLKAEQEHRMTLAKIVRRLDQFGMREVDMVDVEKDLYLPERPDALYCQPDIIVWEKHGEPAVIEYKRSWRHYPTAFLQLGHAAYVMNRVAGINPRLYFIWEEHARPQRLQFMNVSLTQVAQLFGVGYPYKSTRGVKPCLDNEQYIEQ